MDPELPATCQAEREGPALHRGEGVRVNLADAANLTTLI